TICDSPSRRSGAPSTSAGYSTKISSASSRSTRRPEMRRPLFISLGLLVIALAASRAEAQAPAKLKLVFATPPTTYALPHFVAQDQGWLQQRGLDVEEVWLTGDANALRALLSGAGNIAAPGTFPTYSVVAEGGRVKAIGAWQPIVDYVLIAREGITSLKDV